MKRFRDESMCLQEDDHSTHVFSVMQDGSDNQHSNDKEKYLHGYACEFRVYHAPSLQRSHTVECAERLEWIHLWWKQCSFKLAAHGFASSMIIGMVFWIELDGHVFGFIGCNNAASASAAMRNASTLAAMGL